LQETKGRRRRRSKEKLTGEEQMGLPDNQSKEGKFSNSSQFYLCSWKIDKTSKSSSSCNLFFFRFFFVFFFFFFFFGGRPSERVRMRRSLGG
jgi:hypothetical protein